MLWFKRYQEALKCKRQATTEEDKQAAARRRATDELKGFVGKETKIGCICGTGVK